MVFCSDHLFVSLAVLCAPLKQREMTVRWWGGGRGGAMLLLFSEVCGWERWGLRKGLV